MSRAFAVEAVADRLDPSGVRHVDVCGIHTRYYEAGEGEPLVLLHGGQFGFVSSLDDWSLNLPGLAERFHVYALDRLGQGYTDNPRGDDFTFVAVLDHIRGFLDVLGIRRAHFVGHSRGALPVAYLAFEHPELVASAVIVDSSTLAPENPRNPSGRFYADVARRMSPGPPTLASTRIYPEALSRSADHLSDDYVGRLFDVARLPKTAEAQRKMGTLNERVWLPSLDRARQRMVNLIEEEGLPVPTLVVWGFDDPSAPLFLGTDLFERICRRTAQAELHVLNRAGHYSYREQPHAFNRLLASFCLRS